MAVRIGPEPFPDPRDGLEQLCLVQAADLPGNVCTDLMRCGLDNFTIIKDRIIKIE